MEKLLVRKTYLSSFCFASKTSVASRVTGMVGKDTDFGTAFWREHPLLTSGLPNPPPPPCSHYGPWWSPRVSSDFASTASFQEPHVFLLGAKISTAAWRDLPVHETR